MSHRPGTRTWPAAQRLWASSLVLLLLLTGALAPSGAADSSALLQLHLADDQQVQQNSPGPDADTLARYDNSPVPFVGAVPVDWSFTPEVDLTITSIGGSTWFRAEEFVIERDLGPVHPAYELALAQNGSILAYTQGGSDDPALPPQTPRGDYRVDFPTAPAGVRLDAGETVELWVLVWSTNGGPCVTPPDAFPCTFWDSGLAVLFGSQERDSFFELGVAAP